MPRTRTTDGVLASALSIGALTAAVGVVTLAKDLVVANRYGTGEALDVFLIAYLLPSVATVFLASSFASAFMPAYILVRERQGLEAARRLYSSAYVLVILVLAAASLLCLVLLPPALPWIVSGFPPAKQELTVAIAPIVAPTLFASGVATMWTTLLNASHRFAAGAFAPILLPACMMAFVLVDPRPDAYTLAWSALCGSLLQAAVLAPLARRDGFTLLPCWHGVSAELRETFAQYGPLILGALLMSATGIVDQVMAAGLNAGDVAALSYGGKVVSFFAGVVAMAMATAMLPVLSRQLAVDDVQGVHKSIRDASRVLVAATIPATAMLIVVSEPLVRVLFERGAFDAADTALVAWIQQLGALQIPFYALGLLFTRLFSALRRNDVLCIASALSVGIKVALNLLLIPVLGVAGIALSTSIMYAFTLTFLGWRAALFLRERARDVKPDGARGSVPGA